MFRPRPDSPAATVAPRIAVMVEGRTVHVPEGASAAAAVLLAGLPSIRDTAAAPGHGRGPQARGSERAPYCMMGVCFDCLAEIDGVPNRQSCMVTARPGMRIRRQRGARALPSPTGLAARAVPAPHPPTLRAGPSLSPPAGRGAEAALAAPSPREHGERVGVRGRHGRINLIEIGLRERE